MKLLAIIAIVTAWIILAATSSFPDERYLHLSAPECVIKNAC